MADVPAPMSDARPSWLRLLQDRRLLWAVLAVNLGGIVYGFYYYVPQFRVTPVYLWPLVPDSPMAVLLATTAIAMFLWGRDRPTWNLVALGAMVKVGVWTGIILAGLYPDHFAFRWIPGGLDCSGTGFDFRCADLNTYLFWLHLGMAGEALILADRFPRDWRPYVFVALAFVAIDAVDYLLPVDYTGRGCDGVFPHTVPCGRHGLTFAVTAGLSVASVAALAVLGRLAAVGWPWARRSRGR